MLKSRTYPWVKMGGPPQTRDSWNKGLLSNRGPDLLPGGKQRRGNQDTSWESNIIAKLTLFVKTIRAIEKFSKTRTRLVELCSEGLPRSSKDRACSHGSTLEDGRVRNVVYENFEVITVSTNSMKITRSLAVMTNGGSMGTKRTHTI